MAIKKTKTRQAHLTELLKPFRTTYLLNRKRTQRFHAILSQLHELAQDNDEVALAARLNLADYYRAAGDTARALELLRVTMIPSSPQPLFYEGAMMYGALCLEENALLAAHSFRNAALAAGDRTAFSDAYDGLAISIAATTTGAKWGLPAVLVNDGQQADRFWGSRTNCYMGDWNQLGNHTDVVLAYNRPHRQNSDVIMCIVDDDPLFAKRKSLWGNEIFTVVADHTEPDMVTGRVSAGMATGVVGALPGTALPSLIVDTWGNAVQFSQRSG
jgi:hypothetical protein